MGYEKLSFMLIDILRDSGEGNLVLEEMNRESYEFHSGDISLYLDEEKAQLYGWQRTRMIYFKNELVFEEDIIPDADGPNNKIKVYNQGEWESFLKEIHDKLFVLN